MVVFLALSKLVLSVFFLSAFLSVFSSDFLIFPLVPTFMKTLLSIDTHVEEQQIKAASQQKQ